MSDPIRAAVERLHQYAEMFPVHDTDEIVAAVLAAQPAPAVVPVAVSERPWERDGWCDADGRCWWSHGPTPTARWNFLPMEGMDEANGWLLPHWAIPLPPHGGEVQP